MRLINREVPIARVVRELVWFWTEPRGSTVGIRTGTRTATARLRWGFGAATTRSSASAAIHAPWVPSTGSWMSTGSPRRQTLHCGLRSGSLCRRCRHASGSPRSPGDRVGYERDVGLPIRSGLWARLSAPPGPITAVLLEFGGGMGCSTKHFVSRWPTERRHATVELGEVGFRFCPLMAVAIPGAQVSDIHRDAEFPRVWELAQVTARQTQQEIAARNRVAKVAARPQ